jgi:putative ABC transport system permease protein
MRNIKSSIRFLWNNRFFTLINIAGLSIGFICVLLISLWVINQISYDRHITNYQKIYRLTVEVNNSSGYHSHFARCWQPWTRQIHNYFTDIEKIAIMAPLRRTAVKMNEIKFNAEQVYRCNKESLELFDIEVIKGDNDPAFDEPNMLLISESMYISYFENTLLLDSIIQLSGAFDTEFTDFKFVGIFKNFPKTSHIHPDILISLPDPDNFEGWAYTYLTLSEGSAPYAIIQQFPEYANQHLSEEARNTTNIHLQRITDIHLYSKKDREIETNGDVKVVWLFSSIGIAVLAITLINFLNLNLILQLKRNNILIIKKILGSGILESAKGIFLEVTIQIILACLIGLLTVYFLKPFGSLYIYEDTNFLFLSFIQFFIFWFAVIFSIIPQFLIVKRQWNNKISLKGAEIDNSYLLKKGNKGFRKVFVILQFTTSIVLIACAYYIHMQQQFLWQKRMGFDRESVIVLKELNWKMREKYTEFKNRLEGYHNIKQITASMEPPSGYVMDAMSLNMDGIPADEDVSIFVFPVEDNYIDFYDLPIIAGQKFSEPSHVIQKEEYILNETALNHLGISNPEDAIGRRFKLNFSIDSLFKGGTVIGVVKDFNLSPLFEKVKPLVLFQKSIWYSTILIKVDSIHRNEGLQLIRATWDDLYPEYLFDYSFDNDLYRKAYRNEILQSKLSKYLTFLVVVIACLGLFGISTIIIQLRMKEIGIRKVNGASSMNILYMLSKEFLMWILISMIIATPFSLAILHKWSENYPYKVSLSWWLFPMAGFIALLLACISISFYSLKAAHKNPVDVLRYE